ncbi:hypothetical protein TIFTF001_008179 [Ficus carica]|uniref:Uncharacterized protein n=1 Tax=Ficus carica TaxID=3494 RepID=A0AA87ZSL1_FICCA|nr:hypothetical protein TIFTF001_008179 [Ficus carica]
MLLRVRKEWKYVSSSSALVGLWFNTGGRGGTTSAKLIISEASNLFRLPTISKMSFEIATKIGNPVVRGLR